MEAQRSAHSPATYEDLLALPEHLTAELIDGVVYAMARPRLRHAAAATVMTHQLVGAFGLRKPVGGGPGGWVLLIEPELHLGTPVPNTLVLAPDMAGWRRERMPEVPDTAFAELAPDWVCEVLSPGTESHDRILKMEWYRRCGVSWAWIVDPRAHSIEVYENNGRTWEFLGGVARGGATARLRPFDAAEFDITEWWT
jgi:Uma2 family endonuclease